MENRECPSQTELTRMATGVLHARFGEVRTHLERCDKCSDLLVEIIQQNDLLEKRLSRLTLDDVNTAGLKLEAEVLLSAVDSESWLTPQSYELARQTALFSTPCRVGQYELHGLIAPGGMGEVYKATHSRLKREVAVKVIRRNQQDSPLFYENFLREIETVGQLEHPNMVRAYDALEYEGYLFLVMELLTGDSLHAIVRDGRYLTVHELLDVMIGVGKAISHLHENGYLHLDIKPANIMLLANGATKLIDYGLAIRQDIAASGGGVQYGTVGYMPPEQHRGGTVDERSDIFAAGKVFQVLLSKSVASTSWQHASSVQRDLQSLAQRMVAVDPDNRPGNAGQVLRSLLDVKQTLQARSGEPSSRKHALNVMPKSVMGRTIAFFRRYSAVLLLIAVGCFFLTRVFSPGSRQFVLSTLGDVTNSIGMQLNVVTEGEFQMNAVCTIAGEQYFVNELVAIERPFYIGMYEVTQEQYREVMGKNPSHFKGDRMPVESITFAEANDFCQKLSELPEEKSAGRVYRIPTTSEWEYACRAGTTTTFSFGEDDWQIDLHAWYNGNAGSPHAVGSKRANAWGLYDMHGNVNEFCILGNELESLLEGSPWPGDRWGWCGGGWSVTAVECRSGACVVPDQPNRTYSSNGLRVVCNLLPEDGGGNGSGNQFETELYSVEMDLRGEPVPAPIRTENAVIYREEDTTHYWTPDKVNQWAEIEYRLDFPAPIESIVDFGTFIWVYNEHYFPVFDPLAQGTLEVSRDGKAWHVVFHSESGVPLVDHRASVLPLLKGSQVVYLRASLFASVRGKKKVCFSQFLRSDARREPHQLQFLLRSIEGKTEQNDSSGKLVPAGPR
ncbi:bifunctional serine/threonine-protein kinase/formylglycine-generating enzyme family protein [bacterium]|nr:bifunctional serine/threonine-protein kinase/formylglycine-generating enzyme family protein [bacterium]